ncbi:uncharacterized protein wu:fa19b12 [Nematolebias whitei]|uniref:uncharacterized protein wu:fa19b12 n=1 Tax=Nematolebias whitei TaxID=451745 RepID=UPI001898F381|nr:uncharacterized protein wu:fa19b12 [Nematolebias whitei]
MAKRRAENTLLLDSPGKRKSCRPLCSVDMQLESSVARSGAVSPPSLLALLGSRCRKRPHYFENEEKPVDTALYSSPCVSKKLAAADVSTERVSGSFQDRRSSSCTVTSKKKRARVDSLGSETVLSAASDKTVEDVPIEDSVYNSFQYWRVPLPALDLSLLEDPRDDSQTKHNSKVSDSSSDTMET